MEILIAVLTVLVGLISWFSKDLVGQTRKQVSDVDVTVKAVSNRLVEVEKSMVKISSDLEYIKDDVKHYKGSFENSNVKIIRDKKRFE